MIYKGLKAALATQHAKEKILSKPFQLVLGVEIIVPPGMDTDTLGTFTGEIPRVGTMKETVIQKAKMGLDASGLSLGLANEGSFGPHPENPFINADDEMMVFIDQERKFELVERFLTTKTNFSFQEANMAESLDKFLKNIGFPKHGVIVQPKNKPKNGLIFKGIQDYHQLKKAIFECTLVSEEKMAHIETDMRAHMNPTRQKAIRKLAFKLLRRLRNFCPHCQLPGFGIIQVERGLPCEWCQMPTHLVIREIMGCVKCDYQEKRIPRDNPSKANPRFCFYCNP